jgi:hypothetical protein
MRIFGITALWLSLAAAVVAGDGTKPDLSGTWIFNPAKSRFEMTAPTKSIFVIDHQDSRFEFTRTHTWSGESDTLTLQFTTDGKELHQKIGDMETWSRLTWMGEELVLNMKLAYLGEQGTNVVHYRLADGGNTFIAAEWYHMPSRQHHNLWVFDKALEE